MPQTLTIQKFIESVNELYHSNYVEWNEYSHALTLHCDKLTIEDIKQLDTLLHDKECDIRMIKLISMLSTQAPYFDKAMQGSNLESVDLSNIGKNEIKFLAPTLKTLQKLTALDLSFNFIGNDGLIALDLGKLLGLTSLDLTGNLIEDEGLIAIAPDLGKLKLKILNLKINYIGVKGAEALGAALENSSDFTSLDLATNYIRNDGVIALKTLTTCLNLTTLHLETPVNVDDAKIILSNKKKFPDPFPYTTQNNDITYSGIKVLAEIAKNSALTDLNYDGFLYRRGAQDLKQELEESLKINRELKPFFIKLGIKPSDCKISGDSKDTLVTYFQLFDQIYANKAIITAEPKNILLTAFQFFDQIYANKAIINADHNKILLTAFQFFDPIYENKAITKNEINNSLYVDAPCTDLGGHIVDDAE